MPSRSVPTVARQCVRPVDRRVDQWKRSEALLTVTSSAPNQTRAGASAGEPETCCHQMRGAPQAGQTTERIDPPDVGVARRRNGVGPRCVAIGGSSEPSPRPPPSEHRVRSTEHRIHGPVRSGQGEVSSVCLLIRRSLACRTAEAEAPIGQSIRLPDSLTTLPMNGSAARLFGEYYPNRWHPQGVCSGFSKFGLPCRHVADPYADSNPASPAPEHREGPLAPRSIGHVSQRGKFRMSFACGS